MRLSLGKVLRGAGVAALALLLAAAKAAAPAVAAEADAASTWERAQVALPRALTGQRPVLGLMADAEVAAAIERIPPVPRAAVVLLMHGCNGIGIEETNAKLFMLDQGFAVFVPDSFARPGRQSNCATTIGATALAPIAPSLRLDEIDYALARLAEMPFVDRVFLAGSSEGGQAVASQARSPLPLAGVLVLSWHCQGRGPFAGIQAPREVPVLAIIGDDDPWYRARPGRHCGQVFEGRPAAESIVLPGSGHSIFSAVDAGNARRARDAISRFLKAH